MDIKAMLEKITQAIKKYRYAVLVLVIGLVLLAIPVGGEDTNEKITDTASVVIAEPTLEEKLASILSQVDGAGKVQVILTIASGEEIVYQTNEDAAYTGESNSTDTVTVTDADKNQTGLVRQVNPAVYQGAVVVCQGADDPAVQLAIVDAVSKLTGLGTNRISVLKMN